MTNSCAFRVGELWKTRAVSWQIWCVSVLRAQYGASVAAFPTGYPQTFPSCADAAASPKIRASQRGGEA